MKSFLHVMIPIFQFLCLLSLLPECGRNLPPAPRGGFDVGSAGDSYSQEFVDVGYEVLALVTSSPIQGVDATALRQAIDSTKVTSQEELLLDGSPVDAIKYPTKKPPLIEVSRKGWDGMRLNQSKKVFLALHEYLGIMGVDDTNYQVSTRLDRAGICSRTDAIRSEIEKQKGQSCYRLVADDLKYIYKMDLSNRGIDKLKVGDLAGLFSLGELDLSKNNIAGLPPGIFGDMVSLHLLNLSDNKISTLEKGSFSGLVLLDSILGYQDPEIGMPERRWSYAVNLSGNPIDELKSGFLDGLGDSRDIDLCPLRGQFIKKIEPGAFSGLGKAKSFRLCFDVVGRQLPGLAGLDGAKRITLVGKGFRQLPSDLLSGVVMKPIDLEIILDSSKDTLTEDQLKNLNANSDIPKVLISTLDASYDPDPYFSDDRKPLGCGLMERVGRALTTFDCRVYDFRIPGSHCERLR